MRVKLIDCPIQPPDLTAGLAFFLGSRCVSDPQRCIPLTNLAAAAGEVLGIAYTPVLLRRLLIEMGLDLVKVRDPLTLAEYEALGFHAWAPAPATVGECRGESDLRLVGRWIDEACEKQHGAVIETPEMRERFNLAMGENFTANRFGRNLAKLDIEKGFSSRPDRTTVRVVLGLKWNEVYAERTSEIHILQFGVFLLDMCLIDQSRCIPFSTLAAAYGENTGTPYTVEAIAKLVKDGTYRAVKSDKGEMALGDHTWKLGLKWKDAPAGRPSEP